MLEDEGTDLSAPLRIQFRERLVQQQRQRVGQKRAHQGHSCLLTARQRGGIAISETRHARVVKRRFHGGAPCGGALELAR